MELNYRAGQDRFLPDGTYTGLQQRLNRFDLSDRPVVVVYAFDRATMMLPYMLANVWMAPAGVRAIGASLAASGFDRVRVVLQQWTPNFDPRQATLDGGAIQMLCISSMQIHSARALELIRQAWEMGPDRPLIVVGGPKAVYEPHGFFALSPAGMCESDVVVTGEEFVFLQMLERVLAVTGANETLRQGFDRARREQLLEDVPGLTYRHPDSPTNRPQLIQTGIQRLVRDLDELPHSLIGYALLEKAHRGKKLQAKPYELAKVGRRSRYGALVITRGCRFKCHYCPIPAYNQRTWRAKSADRLVREIRDLYCQAGIRQFFGTCDNFFNHRGTIENYFEVMARSQIGRKSFKEVVDFSTEATQIDVYKHRDLLPLARCGGLRGLHFGIEDLDANLINKGQSPKVTLELFEQMCRLGISPMVLMMHYGTQPLRSPGSLRGLINQVDFLRQHGAVGYQCTIYSPAVGTKALGPALEAGTIFKRVAGGLIPDAFLDGNHVVSGETDQPWRQQWNLLRAYARFYNPRNLAHAVFSRRDGCRRDRILHQLGGHLALPVTLFKYWQWIRKLKKGHITVWRGMPKMPFPVRSVGDGPQPGGFLQLAIRESAPVAATA